MPTKKKPAAKIAAAIPSVSVTFDLGFEGGRDTITGSIASDDGDIRADFALHGDRKQLADDVAAQVADAVKRRIKAL